MFKRHDEVRVTNANRASYGMIGYVKEVSKDLQGNTFYKVYDPERGYLGKFTKASLEHVNRVKDVSDSTDETPKLFSFFVTDDNDPVRSVKDLDNLSNIDFYEPFFSVICKPSELEKELSEFSGVREVSDWEHCYAVSGSDVYELRMSFSSVKIV